MSTIVWIDALVATPGKRFVVIENASVDLADRQRGKTVRLNDLVDSTRKVGELDAIRFNQADVTARVELQSPRKGAVRLALRLRLDDNGKVIEILEGLVSPYAVGSED